MVGGGPLVQVGVIVLSVLGLWVGARLLLDAVVRLARRFGLSEFTIGLTVVAMGTSTPELAVSIDAALARAGDIAVANVLGSNIYNIAFVLGVLALVRVIPITGAVARRDGAALLASTLVGGLAVFDLRITRLEGALLAGVFIAYTAYLLRSAQTEQEAVTQQSATDGGAAEAGVLSAATDRVTFRGRDAAFLVGGLVVLLRWLMRRRRAAAMATSAGATARCWSASFSRKICRECARASRSRARPSSCSSSA